MAIFPYPSIANTAIDGGSPIHEDLVGDFHDAHVALITQAIDLQHAEVTLGTGYTKVADVFVPECCDTNAGNVEIVYRFEAKLASAGSRTITGALHTSGGTPQTEKTQAVTVTAYGTFFELRFVDADTKALVNDVGAQLRLKVDSASPVVTVRNLSPSSRIERVT